MGLGSDPLIVKIQLRDRETYLADSIQFTLEYVRINQGSTGTYSVSPSFRGEKPDSSHMDQFYHVECELLGNMDDRMEVMEKFVIAVATTSLEKHGDLIQSICGDERHIQNVLEFAGGRSPLPTYR